MIQTGFLNINPINAGAVIRHFIFGLIIGFIAISFFVFTVDHAPAEWGPRWMIRPLVVTPLVGGLAGLFLYAGKLLETPSKWMKIVAITGSVLAFLILLWIGIILGLDGTMWD